MSEETKEKSEVEEAKGLLQKFQGALSQLQKAEKIPEAQRVADEKSTRLLRSLLIVLVLVGIVFGAVYSIHAVIALVATLVLLLRGS